MSEVKWIKICTDIFDDEKISLIDGMPERDGIIVIWFKLLCMAGKQNNGGVFMLNDKIAYTDEMLATIFRRPLNTVRLALSTFEQFGMVAIINNAYTIPNWEKHQSLDKLEAAREKTRLRVAAHREKQKQLAQCNDYCNGDVTPCNAVDKEEDKDKDKKEDKKKVSKQASFDAIISEYSTDPVIVDLLQEWLKVRKAKRAAMTDRAIKMNIDKLNRLANESRMTVAEYLSEVICRGWAAFYPIDNQRKTQKVGANGIAISTEKSDLEGVF